MVPQIIYKSLQFVLCQVQNDFGKTKFYIDGRDALQSNWLKYVCCSPSVKEQNMMCVQYDNSIYYMVTEDIEIGKELLTYYGDNIAKKLGIPVPKKTSPNSKYKK